MPPRRVVRDRLVGCNVEEQGVPNAPEVQPQGKVTNSEFREAIRMLSQAVTNQVLRYIFWVSAYKKNLGKIIEFGRIVDGKRRRKIVWQIWALAPCRGPAPQIWGKLFRGAVKDRSASKSIFATKNLYTSLGRGPAFRQ
uniref:Gag-pol protein n=1 Tax=Solanum tuberosum TaxID=4113 RepID=M1DY89_SOLTU